MQHHTKNYSALVIMPVGIRLLDVPGETPEEVVSQIEGSQPLQSAMARHITRAGTDGQISFSVPIVEAKIEAVFVNEVVNGVNAPETGLWYERNLSELSLTRNKRRQSRPDAPGVNASSIESISVEATEFQEYLSGKKVADLAMLIQEMTKSASWSIEEELALAKELTTMGQLAFGLLNL